MRFVGYYKKSPKTELDFQFPYGSPVSNLANGFIKPFARLLFFVEMPVVLCLFFVFEKPHSEPKSRRLRLFFAAKVE